VPSEPDESYAQLINFQITPVDSTFPDGPIQKGCICLQGPSFRIVPYPDDQKATAFLSDDVEVPFWADIRLDDWPLLTSNDKVPDYQALLLRRYPDAPEIGGNYYRGLLLHRLPASDRERGYVRRGIWSANSRPRELRRPDDPPAGWEYSRVVFGHPCLHKFALGEPIYRCRTCTDDPTVILCARCFEDGDHGDHRVTYALSTDPSDCGDLGAFNRLTVCKIHSDPVEEMKHRNFEIVLSVAKKQERVFNIY
jgi:Putative zinc finger in N-recognin (UBR box)